MRQNQGRRGIRASTLWARLASLPVLLNVLGVTLGCTGWTVVYSFTSSALLPRADWVGLDQYRRLWANPTWVKAIGNLGFYGIAVLTLSLVFGFILAALLDRQVRGEGLFRTIFLYPFSLSFIVTGLVWKWLLNPNLGLQSMIQAAGWASFHFDPLYDPNTVMLGIILAGLWQGSGLTTVILLTGLRGIDADIWKAARIDGIPLWRAYLQIALPMIRPALATATILTGTAIVKLYDLVIGMTGGGPGTASQVPATYMITAMFNTSNLAQGFAASTTMLLALGLIVVPLSYFLYRGRAHDRD